MEISFARVGPFVLNKIVSGELTSIPCETESSTDSHSFVQNELYNGRELIFDLSYDEVKKELKKIVLTVDNLSTESLFGNVIRYTYQLKLRDSRK